MNTPKEYVSTVSPEYAAALKEHNAACAEYTAAARLYRARSTGDNEFMLACQAYKRSTAVFDAAWLLERNLAFARH